MKMALSAPSNYQQEAKEIPLYGDINSEKKTPKSIPKAKKGTPPHQTMDPVKVRAQMVAVPLLKVNQVRTTLD
jgi:hypothetical protein